MLPRRTWGGGGGGATEAHGQGGGLALTRRGFASRVTSRAVSAKYSLAWEQN